MKNLIIHPNDYTTHFLSQIYAPLQNKMVIDSGVSKNELSKLIETHDRVIMLGHGLRMDYCLWDNSQITEFNRQRVYLNQGSSGDHELQIFRDYCVIYY